MNTDEFPEESDSSDDDYVPDSKVEDAASEVDSDGDSEEPLSDSESNSSGRKRRKKLKKISKKAKATEENNVSETTHSADVVASENLEEHKKKADDLWADFMKDTGFKSKNSKPSISSSQNKTQQSSSTSNIQKRKEGNSGKSVNKVKITQIFKFAGEEVQVENEVDANSDEAKFISEVSPETPVAKKAGIGSLLSQLGKKTKISTLEKSKLDWDRFKKDENIEDELQTHNKGKDGYLERQDFLQRADLRRFEIEKKIRNVERAKRFNSTL